MGTNCGGSVNNSIDRVDAGKRNPSRYNKGISKSSTRANLES